MVVSGQVKITVVGEVEYRILVADSVVNNMQSALGIQTVSNADVGISREALVTGRAVQEKADAVFLVGCYLPKPKIVGVGTGVEVVAALVGGQMVVTSTKRKGGPFEPVGIASYCGTDIGRAFDAVLRAVVAENHIAKSARGIGNGQCHKRRAAIGDGRGDAATGYCVEAGLFTAGHFAEKFLHWKSPLNF